MSTRPAVDLVQYLDFDDRATLVRWCRRLGIEPTEWRQVPWLATTFETLAVEAQATRIQLRSGRGRLWALAEAAAQLGVSHDTHRSRMRRLHAAARGGHFEP